MRERKLLMKHRKEEIIHYDYAKHKDNFRMPLNERASIFLPFSALSEFEEELKKVRVEK